jgi:hypothetical protein
MPPSTVNGTIPSKSADQATTVDLTICTSVMPADLSFVHLNWQLISQLNDVEGWKWLVIDNSEEPERLHLKSWDDRVEVMDGVETNRTLPEWCQGSYHHAGAFNKALHSIESRFALFLDPDFYIVRPHWIADLTSYMQSKGLAILGVPWHPKWYKKYRYFPCAHALLVDLSQISTDMIDFTPALRDAEAVMYGSERNYSHFWNIPPMPSRRQRRTVATSNDTGYPLYRTYATDRDIRWESMKPVYRPGEDFNGPKYAVTSYGRALEKLFPEKYSFLPKRSETYSAIGFRELGHADVTHLGWEEFLWQDEPFGFHMRRFRNDGLEESEATRIITEVLSGFCESCSFELS